MSHLISFQHLYRGQAKVFQGAEHLLANREAGQTQGLIQQPPSVVGQVATHRH